MLRMRRSSKALPRPDLEVARTDSAEVTPALRAARLSVKSYDRTAYDDPTGELGEVRGMARRSML